MPISLSRFLFIASTCGETMACQLRICCELPAAAGVAALASSSLLHHRGMTSASFFLNEAADWGGRWQQPLSMSSHGLSVGACWVTAYRKVFLGTCKDNRGSLHCNGFAARISASKTPVGLMQTNTQLQHGLTPSIGELLRHQGPGMPAESTIEALYGPGFVKREE